MPGPETEDEALALADLPGYNGCKYFGQCRGEQCKDPGKWSTIPLIPTDLPGGETVEDHVVHECPAGYLADDEVHAAVVLWSDFVFYGSAGLPFEGGLLDQPAQMTEMFRVLSSTAQLQRAYLAEEAERMRKFRGL